MYLSFQCFLIFYIPADTYSMKGGRNLDRVQHTVLVTLLDSAESFHTHAAYLHTCSENENEIFIVKCFSNVNRYLHFLLCLLSTRTTRNPR